MQAAASSISTWEPKAGQKPVPAPGDLGCTPGSPQPWLDSPAQLPALAKGRPSCSFQQGTAAEKLPWALCRAMAQAADGYLSVTPLLFPSSWLMTWKCSVLGFPWGQTALLKMSIENAVNLSSLKMDRIQKCESSKKRCNCIILVELPGHIS